MIGCWSLAELTKSNCSACWFKEALQSKTCFEVQYHHTGMLGPLGNGHFSQPRLLHKVGESMFLHLQVALRRYLVLKSHCLGGWGRGIHRKKLPQIPPQRRQFIVHCNVGCSTNSTMSFIGFDYVLTDTGRESAQAAERWWAPHIHEHIRTRDCMLLSFPYKQKRKLSTPERSLPFTA